MTDHCAVETKAEGREKGNGCFRIAHFSDLHIACPEQVRFRDLLTKRVLGSLSWHLKRRKVHDDALLTILRQDLQSSKSDHCVISGDLTHLGLPEEFVKARTFLDTLGSPAQVMVLAGNHDTYIKSAWHQTFAHWFAYMRGDQPSAIDDIDQLEQLYPVVRLRGSVALIGVNTALPTAPFLASGTIGSVQMEKLEQCLAALDGRNLFRVLVLHHPPVQGIVSKRKCLTDMAALHQLLARHRVHLILFGHAHVGVNTQLNTALGPIPVQGVPSASAIIGNRQHQAAYFLYDIREASGQVWHLSIRERCYLAKQNCFVDVSIKEWRLPAITA